MKTDSFTQPVSERVPSPVELTNVYAVLKGTDAEDAKRIFLVTGHYDSRNSDPLDKTGIAPGANDDASGTAVSLECARVLSKLKFPATIVFLAVAGEVLWRATTAPDWEHSQSIPKATRATVPVSKDNVIFAVQAIAASGHRSLAVVPQPER